MPQYAYYDEMTNTRIMKYEKWYKTFCPKFKSVK